MQQPRANVLSQATEQAEDTTVKIISQPIELTEAQLLQVVGGGGPNGGWTDAVATTTAGPNGGW